jgi:UDPglucose--hexose-1-phosphate uridylyltransferase
MKANLKKISKAPEFRKDMVSGDWILVAPGRSKRPVPKIKKAAPPDSGEKDCPFDHLKFQASPPILWLPHPINRRPQAASSFNDWWVAILPNKFPALAAQKNKVCPEPAKSGFYLRMDGVGFHEVIITRDHRRPISEMSPGEIATLFEAYQKRYCQLKRQECVEYILIFHNQGRNAGSSLFHPHSQLIAMPAIPPDVSKSLEGSRIYRAQNGKCVHCVMLDWEKSKKIRLVYENKLFVVVEPYAPRVAYETRIFPKKHSARFEEINESERAALADALGAGLRALKKALGDPDYNFFIHTAPVKADFNPDYYHWHLEILPRVALWAGLELGTGIEIVSVLPEQAAAELRKALK